MGAGDPALVRYLLLAVLALAIPDSSILAQPEADTSALVYHHEPWPLAPGQWVLTTGLVLALLPEPVVENEIPTPAAQIQYKRGLFPFATLIATFSTNVVTNLAQLGIQWNDTSDRMSYAVGSNAVGFLGWMSVEDTFDEVWAFAVGANTYIRAGHRFDEFSVSATFAASMIFDAQTYVRDEWTPARITTRNDVSATLAVEQPFLENGRISIGVVLTLSFNPYHSWILFNTFDQYLLIPEFFVGYQL